MKLCNWPGGCKRPVRANEKCASHNVMWQREHPETPGVPKRRGTKAREVSAEELRRTLSKPRLLGILLTGPHTLGTLAKKYGGHSSVLLALRKMEASGLKIERTSNPSNAREVLRHVEVTEAVRWLRSLAEEKE